MLKAPTRKADENCSRHGAGSSSGIKRDVWAHACKAPPEWFGFTPDHAHRVAESARMRAGQATLRAAWLMAAGRRSDAAAWAAAASGYEQVAARVATPRDSFRSEARPFSFEGVKAKLNACG